MEKESNNNEISITWRGKKYVLSMNSDSTLEELGHKLQKMTAVKSDTLKLIVQSHKSSKLLSPFSDEHSHLTLQQASITEGKPIRMMGVPKEEMDQILKNEKLNMRIAGFDEEEKRIRQMSNGFDTPLKLPTGNYVFGDFRTLDLPGIELNPPASEALRLMHTLAADKGIVAIMNKHKWRVGIMTEMAPEGYVGVSPLCLLGLNKNHGEEISLRLRTDDLKGFRKYQSIKKTLLHELAHMVFSEHDAKFYALDSQLNKEANALDWTRSTGHTLNGSQKSQHYEPEFHVTNNNTSLGHKLGGTRNQKPDSLANARASSVAAAYKRLIIPSTTPEAHKKPDPDNQNEPDPDDSVANEPMETDPSGELARNGSGSEQEVKSERNEPDPDDDIENGPMETGPYGELARKGIIFEENEVKEERNEPDPDDDIKNGPMETDPCGELAKNGSGKETKSERNGQDPDADIENGPMETDPYGELARSVIFEENEADKVRNEPDPDESIKNGPMETGPYGELARKGIIFEENEVKEERNEILNNDEELQRIQDPVVIACNHLNESIRRLQSEVNHSDAVRVFQTLVKIIKNVIQHPDEIKFKKLRKANPVIQKNIASYKGAMEILFLIGFCEDVVHDEIGRAEAYLVLKRNDPGLLWLAKSSLETVV